jgi:hypothetical protein
LCASAWDVQPERVYRPAPAPVAREPADFVERLDAAMDE